MLLSHVVVGTNNLEKAKKFYDATLKIKQAEIIDEGNPNRILYAAEGQMFIVTKPINGKEATISNGATIGLSFNSPEEIKKWHQAGLENGGITIEAPPGIRQVGKMKLFLAYLRDPDGNKLCAIHHLKS